MTWRGEYHHGATEITEITEITENTERRSRNQSRFSLREKGAFFAERKATFWSLSLKFLP